MHHLLYSTVFVRAGRRVGVVSDARYSAFVAQRTALERAENELRAYTLTLAKWRELLKPPYAHVPKLRMNMNMWMNTPLHLNTVHVQYTVHMSRTKWHSVLFFCLVHARLQGPSS